MGGPAGDPADTRVDEDIDGPPSQHPVMGDPVEEEIADSSPPIVCPVAMKANE
jgi:hypothetical protein